jgi:hypothetical protein
MAREARGIIALMDDPCRRVLNARAVPLLLLICMLVLCDSARAQVSLGSLLQDMVDLDSVARWPVPSFSLKQASSYDR